MQVWKLLQAHIEAHFNRALLLSILACLVILLTYLLGGAGAFVALRQMLFPGAPSSALTTSPGTSHGSTSTAKSTPPGARQSGLTPIVARSTLTVALQVSPLDLPLNCALGGTGAQVVTVRNPDSVAHHFALGWNGTSGSAAGFVATVLDGGPANTVAAHGTRLVSIAVLPLSLNPNATSQYLWISDDTSGTASVVAKVHVSCVMLPVPTVTLPPLP